MYRRWRHWLNGTFDPFHADPISPRPIPLHRAAAQNEKGSGPGGPLPSLTGESFEMWGRLAQGVADGVELRAGLAAEGGQGDDADDGDEGQEERVLHQGGATLGVAEACTQVRGDGLEHVHVVSLSGLVAPFPGLSV